MKPQLADILPEIKFTASRSGGPGGQHVNKVNTRVTLRWPVYNSTVLSDEQKAIIAAKLSGYLNNEGELLLTARESRSQQQNKESALQRLDDLLTRAFHKPKARKPTRPTRASVKKRLEAKKKQAEKKRLRKGLD